MEKNIIKKEKATRVRWSASTCLKLDSSSDESEIDSIDTR